MNGTKRGAMQGQRGAIVTWLDGRYRTNKELAELSGDKKLKPHHVYERLKRLGFPRELDADSSVIVLAPLSEPKQDLKPFEMDGKRYSARALERMFDVPASTLAHKKALTGKTVYTRAELEAMSRGNRTSGPHSRRKRNDVDLRGIPCGDLAKLSGSKNTGAGRGEIPNDEWIAMAGKRKGAMSVSCYAQVPTTGML